MLLSYSEYKSIVELSPNLIWRAGLDTKCDYFNATWLNFTGRTMQQEVGDGWAEGVHPDDFDRCVKTYLDNFAERKPFEMEYRLRRFDGEWRWLNDKGTPAYNEQGIFEGYIGSCIDVTDKIEGYFLKEMAQNDGLTGIANRQHSMALLQSKFEKIKNSGGNLTIAMLDIDKFKLINDFYGHQVGDSALKFFASILDNTIRNDDLLGRYGGDEFIVAFFDLNLSSVEKIINRLHKALKSTKLKIADKEIVLSTSVGICELTNENNIEDIIRKADQCMYEAKRSKANNI